MSSPQQNTNQAQAPTGTTPPPMDQPFHSQYNHSQVGNQYDSDYEWFSTGHLHQEQNRHSQYNSAYYLSHPELPPPGLGHHSNGHGRILNQQATSLPPNFELPDHFGNTLHQNQSTTPYQPPPHPCPLSPSLPTPAELVVKAQKKAVDPKIDRKPEVKAEKKKRQQALPKNDESDSGGSGNEARLKKKGGRTKVGDMLPIGQKGWEAVVSTYNKWARKNGYPERERPPLANKFNSLVTIAKMKPTGDAEHRQMYAEALMAEDSLNEKAAIGDVQDDVVEISSNDDDDDDNPQMKTAKGTKKVNAPLHITYGIIIALTPALVHVHICVVVITLVHAVIYTAVIPIIILVIAIHDATPHCKVIIPTHNIHHVGVIPPCKIGILLTFQSLGLIQNYPPLNLSFLLLLQCHYLLYSKPHIQEP
ncbi:hypothetical protein F5877DRAFT_69295 [Lentinula edodes]|nr:hypothetical protein F5877DRAFT_69295 [Lentinula edodes]